MINLGIIWEANLAGYQEKHGPMKIVGYADSSYTRNLEDRKLIIGYCFFLGGEIVTWCSKRQQIVSISISETKYIAISHRAREKAWIRRFLNELISDQALRKMDMLGDNETSLILTKNFKSQDWIKHINVMHYHI